MYVYIYTYIHIYIYMCIYIYIYVYNVRFARAAEVVAALQEAGAVQWGSQASSTPDLGVGWHYFVYYGLSCFLRRYLSRAANWICCSIRHF